MEGIFNAETWRRVFAETLAKLGTTLAEFLPRLVATLAILAAGWLLAKTVEFVASRTLRRLGLDGMATRLRAHEVLNRAGISAPASQLVSRLLFWLLMLLFVLSAFETLGFTAVTATIDRFIAYLPNVVAAGLIVLFSLLLGRLARHLIASGAAVAQWVHADRLGAAVSSLVSLVGAVLAIAQLGVQTEILVSVITVMIGAVTLTMGFAFALGAKPVITHILAGHFLRQSTPVGAVVEVDGKKGEVERVGPTDTLVRDGDQHWSIPNRRLLEEIVGR